MNVRTDLDIFGNLTLNTLPAQTNLDVLTNNSGLVGTRTLGSMALENASSFLDEVNLSLPPIFNVTTSQATPGNPNLVAAFNNQSANTIFAAPDGLAGTPTFRQLVIDDIDATGTPGSTTFLRGDGTWAAPPGGGLNNVVEDLTPQLGGNLDAQNNNITGVNSITASAALFGNSPANLRAFNVRGNGLNGRLSLQGGSGDNPGLEMTTDGNASRVLLRLFEVGTDGTSLEIFTERDGGSISKAFTVGDDAILWIHPTSSGITPTLNAGIRNNSGTMQFKDAAGSWTNMSSGGGGASQLSDLSDVNTSTPTNRNVLIADGTDFESRALVEADISDLQSYLLNVSGQDHTTLSNIGTNSHAQIDTHIADNTVHFTQASISITESQISDLGSYLENIVEDTTPQLGGNLDGQSNNITAIQTLSFSGFAPTIDFTTSSGLGSIDGIGDLNFASGSEISESLGKIRLRSSSGEGVEIVSDNLFGNTILTLYDTTLAGKTVNLKWTNVTASRDLEFPNSDGTFALTSDIIDDHTNLSNIGTNTHAQIDTHIADTDIHVERKVGFAASNSTTTIPANQFTRIILSNEIEDTDSAWNGSVFTVPTGQGGIYEIFGHATFASVNNGNRGIVGIEVNGSLTALLGRGVSGGTNVNGYGGAVRLNLSAGDQLEMVCWCDNATSMTGNTGYITFSAYKMR